jgi:hypothetical protein
MITNMNGDLIVNRGTKSERDRLFEVIEKNRKKLQEITDKVESLSEELQNIEDVYNARVGSLYRKDKMLDSEISRFRRIFELMRFGMSYEDALQEVSEEKVEEEEGEFDFYLDRDEEEKSQIFELSDIRKVWKKLVQKFHPDLANDRDEKILREHMMKTINNAYAKKDFHTLKSIEEKELLLEVEEEIQLDQLETLLVDLENALVRASENYKQLVRSQWYSWRRKTSKQRDELLREMEREVLRDIIRKELVLDALRKKTELSGSFVGDRS